MVDFNRVMMYISRAIPKYSNGFEDPQAIHYLYAVLIQNSPDAAIQLLQGKIGESISSYYFQINYLETPEFVVEVWRNVLLEILDMRYKFMKQTGKTVQTIDEADNQTDVNNNVKKKSVYYSKLF